MGFKLVEVPFPYTVDVDDLKKEAEKYNLKHVLINAPPGMDQSLREVQDQEPLECLAQLGSPLPYFRFPKSGPFRILVWRVNSKFLGNFEAGDRGLAAKILISHANDRFNQSLNTAIKYAKALSSPR